MREKVKFHSHRFADVSTYYLFLMGIVCLYMYVYIFIFKLLLAGLVVVIVIVVFIYKDSCVVVIIGLMGSKNVFVSITIYICKMMYKFVWLCFSC